MLQQVQIENLCIQHKSHTCAHRVAEFSVEKPGSIWICCSIHFFFFTCSTSRTHDNDGVVIKGSFVDVQGSFVDMQGSVADIQGSFADIHGSFADM